MIRRRSPIRRWYGPDHYCPELECLPVGPRHPASDEIARQITAGVRHDGDDDVEDNDITPDAIRRIQNAPYLGGALVMPTASGPDASWEVCVSLEAEAMDGLCADERWTSWTSRIM